MTDSKKLDFIYNDGGRIGAGYKELTKDCAVRAIAIAAELDYKFVHYCINLICKEERKYIGYIHAIRRRIKYGKFNSDNGVSRYVIDAFMFEGLRWDWISTTSIEDLPLKGRLLVLLPNHLSAVIDGVIHDLGYSSWNGKFIQGYYQDLSTIERPGV